LIQWGYPMPELSSNKRARFDYEILKEYEAGIELFGFEVKSIKDRHIRQKTRHKTMNPSVHGGSFCASQKFENSSENRHKKV